jgi:hypothetical protein
MSRTLELPEPIYQELLAVARESGQTPAAWIAARLAGKRPTPPAGDPSLIDARRRLWGHVVATGSPTGLDNDRLDAELARQALDPHERDGEGEEKIAAPDR